LNLPVHRNAATFELVPQYIAPIKQLKSYRADLHDKQTPTPHTHKPTLLKTIGYMNNFIHQTSGRNSKQ